MVGRRSVRSGILAGPLLTALSLPFSAHAAAADDSAESPSIAPSSPGAITYTPQDFSRFAPRTALDMVEKIPDFSITETSSDRGLGQASENVLVNGARVSGKSNDARAALSRIAADAVERIEIVDGATLGIPGLTGRVANVVVRSNRVQGHFRWDPQFRSHVPDQWLTGSVSLSGRIGATDFSLSLSNEDGLRRGGVGPEIVRDGSGAIILNRYERDVFAVDEPHLAGSVHRDFADGSVLNLNLSGELYRYRARFTSLSAPPSGAPITDELYRSREHEWNAEGGGDYEFDLGGGRLKLIGLQSFEHSPSISIYQDRERSVGAITFGQRYASTSDEGESVLRAEYGWSTTGGDWQIAVEGAYNFLDVTAAYSELTANGIYSPLPLPGADTFVDEWRAETTVTRGWRITPQLTLQTMAGFEFSRIRQASAGGLSRRFWRPKGTAALSWIASPRLTVNASVAREVGQLSFYDFSSAVDLQNRTTRGGNVRLVPEQTWRAKAEAVRSLGTAGSVTLGGYHEWISDIVDRVPLSPTLEGVGNLPRARRWAGFVRGTLLLDAIGWHGGRLNASAEFTRSRVRDPLTGHDRRISNDPVRSWSVDLRHDIPHTPIAWGGSLSETREGALYRLDQYYDVRLTRPIATLFVEHKDVRGLTVRLSARNLLNGRDDLYRIYYVDRRNGPIDSSERQTRSIRVIGMLTISGSF